MAALNLICEAQFEQRLVDAIESAIPAAHRTEADPPGERTLELVRSARMLAAQLAIEDEASVAGLAAYLAGHASLDPEECELAGALITPLLDREGASGPATVALLDHRLRGLEAQHPFAARLRRQIAEVRRLFP